MAEMAEMAEIRARVWRISGCGWRGRAGHRVPGSRTSREDVCATKAAGGQPTDRRRCALSNSVWGGTVWPAAETVGRAAGREHVVASLISAEHPEQHPHVCGGAFSCASPRRREAKHIFPCPSRVSERVGAACACVSSDPGRRESRRECDVRELLLRALRPPAAGPAPSLAIAAVAAFSVTFFKS
jgi:hypothetical protein